MKVDGICFMNDTTLVLVIISVALIFIALFVTYSDEIEAFSIRKVTEKKKSKA